MNNKFLVGGLIGGVASFLLGYLVYGLALSSMMSEEAMAGVNRDMAAFSWPFLILGNFGFGFLYAYILTKSNTGGFGGAATMGAVLGFFFAFAYNSIMYATTNLITIKGICLHVVASVVVGALVCGIIGAYLGKAKTA